VSSHGTRLKRRTRDAQLYSGLGIDRINDHTLSTLYIYVFHKYMKTNHIQLQPLWVTMCKVLNSTNAAATPPPWTVWLEAGGLDDVT
jgi:hypothetical protein